MHKMHVTNDIITIVMIFLTTQGLYAQLAHAPSIFFNLVCPQDHNTTQEHCFTVEKETDETEQQTPGDITIDAHIGKHLCLESKDIFICQNFWRYSADTGQ